MSRLDGTQIRTVLYEGPGSAPIEPAVRSQIMSALLDKGFAVTALQSSTHLTAAERDVVVILGRFADSPPDFNNGFTVRFQPIDGIDAPAIVAAVEQLIGEHGAVKAGAWKPWFPVIDYSRCTNCMQCLSFCLFDVYGVSKDRKIQVRNQDNCKTDCPACSRVCPEVAIMFPKYRHAPINGDQVSSDDMRREAMKVDISALLGGDIYAMLRDRSVKATSRFSKERDDERAIKERQNCLRKLQQDMDIPAEVLASLPSVDEIRAKAQQAAARAQAAMAPETEVQ
ncbi:MAG: ferredoxin family protein [Acidobacteria bacterium]|nr:ferredoxin family protein [Acidobacteriota bacterium]